MKLPEDAALAGFTPLMYNIQDVLYAKEDADLVREPQPRAHATCLTAV